MADVVLELTGVPADLYALAAKLAADPTDVLTVQALADWVEEKGGECAPLRELLVGDGDWIVVGLPGPHSLAQRDAIEANLDQVKDWFAARGRDVLFSVMPADWTIRQIKAKKGE